ncbi:MAG: hypothetical protein MUC36_10130 [Planctomycetes bacterium]|jgi:hypothetical protein|nr:hypothetical protein [Planctomycetota bacterium]
MLRAQLLSLHVLGCLVTGMPAQRTTDITVDTIVVDGNGQPVAGAEFADMWSHAGGRWQGQLCCSPADAKEPLRSDAEGRLRGQWTMDPFDRPLLGWSADRLSCAIARPTANADHSLSVREPIVLRPAVVLRGEVKASGPVSVQVIEPYRPTDVRCRFMMGFGFDAPRFALPLPPGHYEVSARAGLSGARPRTIVLPAGRAEVDAGSFTIQWQPFDLVGEVLPDWELAAADNLPLAQATLPSFRGKPLLVVFDEWGRSRSPNQELRRGVADLARHARRSEFAVVLFDTSTRGPWPDQPPDEPVVERVLPVLRPAMGKNADALYGSNWAVVAVDADGRLLHCGRGLAEALAAIERVLPAGEKGK